MRSNDEKSPVILFGDEAATALKKISLKGLALVAC